MIFTREPTVSNKLFKILEYFAQGGMAYSDSLPSGLPHQELFPVLVEQKLVKEIPINPNEFRWHEEKTNRRSYYVISPKGKELYFLEKEIRKEQEEQKAKQASDNMETVQTPKKDFCHDLLVSTVSNVTSSGISHLLSNLANLIKALLKLFISH